VRRTNAFIYEVAIAAGVAFFYALAAIAGVTAPSVVAATASAESTGTISGTVFDDANRNGVRDPGETPFPGVQLWIDKTFGGNVGYAITDADGHYTVSSLGDSGYRIWFASSDWQTLRNDWVPTTTGSLRFERTVSLVGAATADFGLRRIVRSTTPGAPVTAITGRDGLRVESYNDAVTATEIYHELQSGSLLGPEQSVTEVRFDLGDANVTHSSWTGSEGAYTSYSATIDTDYLTWLIVGNKSLFHEYGHAWSLYHAILTQQTEALDGYLSARGVLGDPRVGTSVYWDPKEMIAEDYRQLFGSGAALTYAPANTEIPRATDVPGLTAWLRDAFTQPPAGDPVPPSSPGPSTPLEEVDVSDLVVNPTIVTTSGAVEFEVSMPAAVTVRIVDAAGHVVRTLMRDESRQAGSTSTIWDRKTDAGRKAKAGSYAVVVTAADQWGATDAASTGFTVNDPKGRR
jgi:hypothetical protein